MKSRLASLIVSLVIGTGMACLMLWAVTPRVVQADTLVVANTNDSGPCSLSECIQVAQNGDTIVFSLTANSTINLASSLSITKTLTIDGSTAPGLRISGGNAVRVFNAAAPLTLVRLAVVNGNASSGSGGGMTTNSALTLTSVSFIRNTAIAAGAIFGTGPMTISDTDFISNTASLNGGAIFAQFDQVVLITSSRFISNTANFNGGAVYLYVTNGSRIENSLFSGNRAGNEGGALFVANTAIQISANRFFENVTTNDGAVYIRGETSGPRVAMDNNIFGANQSVAGAADVALGGNFPSRLDGWHNTFTSAGGVGLALVAGDDVDGDSVVLTNTIVSGYTVGVQTGPFAATLTLNGVLWDNVSTPTVGSGITVTNAYTGSAGFANPPARDYHLTAGSTAIDRGVNAGPAVDIDGDARPQGSAPDLGADEYLNRVYLPLVRN
ncbi:MAG: choice-of-anchor Q domain-containing protein [Anaerolineales bacterium]